MSVHGVRATQAGHGVRATQAGHGVRATQAGHGVRATQAGPLDFLQRVRALLTIELERAWRTRTTWVLAAAMLVVAGW